MEHGFTILLLEDDPNDALLLQRALRKNNILNPVHVVRDGLEGIDYLAGLGKYADREKYPFPNVLILDIKMPRMTGLEFLEWIKRHPQYRVIPTLILSSSQEAVDVAQAYALGANSYMVKPAKIDDLQELARIVHEYWIRCVSPPRNGP